MVGPLSKMLGPISRSFHSSNNSGTSNNSLKGSSAGRSGASSTAGFGAATTTSLDIDSLKSSSDALSSSVSRQGDRKPRGFPYSGAISVVHGKDGSSANSSSRNVSRSGSKLGRSTSNISIARSLSNAISSSIGSHGFSGSSQGNHTNISMAAGAQLIEVSPFDDLNIIGTSKDDDDRYGLRDSEGDSDNDSFEIATADSDSLGSNADRGRRDRGTFGDQDEDLLPEIENIYPYQHHDDNHAGVWNVRLNQPENLNQTHPASSSIIKKIKSKPSIESIEPIPEGGVFIFEGSSTTAASPGRGGDGRNVVTAAHSTDNQAPVTDLQQTPTLQPAMAITTADTSTPTVAIASPHTPISHNRIPSVNQRTIGNFNNLADGAFDESFDILDTNDSKYQYAHRYRDGSLNDSNEDILSDSRDYNENDDTLTGLAAVFPLTPTIPGLNEESDADFQEGFPDDAALIAFQGESTMFSETEAFMPNDPRIEKPKAGSSFAFGPLTGTARTTEAPVTNGHRRTTSQPHYPLAAGFSFSAGRNYVYGHRNASSLSEGPFRNPSYAVGNTSNPNAITQLPLYASIPESASSLALPPLPPAPIRVPPALQNLSSPTSLSDLSKSLQIIPDIQQDQLTHKQYANAQYAASSTSLAESASKSSFTDISEKLAGPFVTPPTQSPEDFPGSLSRLDSQLSSQPSAGTSEPLILTTNYSSAISPISTGSSRRHLPALITQISKVQVTHSSLTSPVSVISGQSNLSVTSPPPMSSLPSLPQVSSRPKLESGFQESQPIIIAVEKEKNHGKNNEVNEKSGSMMALHESLHNANLGDSKSKVSLLGSHDGSRPKLNGSNKVDVMSEKSVNEESERFRSLNVSARSSRGALRDVFGLGKESIEDATAAKESHERTMKTLGNRSGAPIRSRSHKYSKSHDVRYLSRPLDSFGISRPGGQTSIEATPESRIRRLAPGDALPPLYPPSVRYASARESPKSLSRSTSSAFAMLLPYSNSISGPSLRKKNSLILPPPSSKIGVVRALSTKSHLKRSMSHADVKGFARNDEPVISEKVAPDSKLDQSVSTPATTTSGPFTSASPQTPMTASAGHGSPSPAKLPGSSNRFLLEATSRSYRQMFRRPASSSSQVTSRNNSNAKTAHNRGVATLQPAPSTPSKKNHSAAPVTPVNQIARSTHKTPNSKDIPTSDDITPTQKVPAIDKQPSPAIQVPVTPVTPAANSSVPPITPTNPATHKSSKSSELGLFNKSLSRKSSESSTTLNRGNIINTTPIRQDYENPNSNLLNQPTSSFRSDMSLTVPAVQPSDHDGISPVIESSSQSQHKMLKTLRNFKEGPDESNRKGFLGGLARSASLRRIGRSRTSSPSRFTQAHTDASASSAYNQWSSMPELENTRNDLETANPAWEANRDNGEQPEINAYKPTAEQEYTERKPSPVSAAANLDSNSRISSRTPPSASPSRFKLMFQANRNDDLSLENAVQEAGSAADASVSPVDARQEPRRHFLWPTRRSSSQSPSRRLYTRRETSPSRSRSPVVTEQQPITPVTCGFEDEIIQRTRYFFPHQAKIHEQVPLYNRLLLHPRDTIVLEYEGLTLYNSDLMNLQDDGWLNDNNLAFAYEYLESTLLGNPTALVHKPSISRYYSYFSKNNTPSDTSISSEPKRSDTIILLKPAIAYLLMHSHSSPESIIAALPSVENARFVFVPVNDNADITSQGGTHWSLLVVCVNARKALYYDTLYQGVLTRAGAQASERMSKLLGFPLHTVPVSTPVQVNTSDCGILVAEITALLLKRLVSIGAHEPNTNGPDSRSNLSVNLGLGNVLLLASAGRSFLLSKILDKISEQLQVATEIVAEKRQQERAFKKSHKRTGSNVSETGSLDSNDDSNSSLSIPLDSMTFEERSKLHYLVPLIMSDKALARMDGSRQ